MRKIRNAICSWRDAIAHTTTGTSKMRPMVIRFGRFKTATPRVSGRNNINQPDAIAKGSCRELPIKVSKQAVSARKPAGRALRPYAPCAGFPARYPMRRLLIRSERAKSNDFAYEPACAPRSLIEKRDALGVRILRNRLQVGVDVR